MKVLLWVALILNLTLCICEIYALGNIKGKWNILKYYTYLQNFLALAVSLPFCVYLLGALLFDRMIPEYIRGLRYVTTCGLTATTIIFVLFLSSKSKNLMQEEDFIKLSPAKANFILHYFCPFIALLSFVLFERQIPLTASPWTLYAAIPSCLYWTAYLILSVTKLWKEPYDFSSKRKGALGTVLEVLTMVSFPLLFILVTFVLWQIK